MSFPFVMLLLSVVSVVVDVYVVSAIDVYVVSAVVEGSNINLSQHTSEHTSAD